MAPLPNALLHFGPGQSSYLTATQRRVEQETQGTTVSENLSVRYLLTASLAEAGATLQATFVIDSVVEVSTEDWLDGEIGDTKGKIFTAKLAATGELLDFRGRDDSTPFSQLLSNQVGDFYPHLPVEGLSAGANWIDSSETPQEQGGMRLTVRAITRYQAGEWKEVDGRFTLPIQGSRTYLIQGSGEQFGEPFTLEGQGATSSTSYFSPTGLYLGSVSEDILQGEIAIDAIGMTVPLRQTQVDTVRVVQQ